MPNLGIDSRVTVTGLSVSPELAPFAECIATLDSTLFFYIKDSFSLSDSLTRSLLHSIIHSYSAPRCRPPLCVLSSSSILPSTTSTSTSLDYLDFLLSFTLLLFSLVSSTPSQSTPTLVFSFLSSSLSLRRSPLLSGSSPAFSTTYIYTPSDTFPNYLQMKTIAVVNATGRQAASLIRVASAVGYLVRAQVHSLKGFIAQELQGLPNVTLFQGPLLDNDRLIDSLFHGAQLAFINTTSQAGDEVAIGRALADAAKRAGTIQHYIYSSMPDHSVHGPWPPVPLWAPKFTVENYVRQLELPATFVYAGIYNNNFTSLPYPLFQMELMSDGSFEWHAPFDPDVPLPWLDAEHDVGPTLLQIFKDGPKRWLGHRYFPFPCFSNDRMLIV